MSFKKLLFVMLVVIVGMFSLMLTTSYAWYSFNEGSTTFDGMTSNEDITVTYQSGEYINTSIAVPISSDLVDKYSEKSNFNIKVNNNKEYNEILIGVSLTDVVIDDALKDSNFKIDLYYQGSIVKSVNGSSITTGTDIELDDVILNNDLTNMFEIRVYILDNGEDQSSMMDKQFSGKIKVDVISRLKTTLTDFENIPDIYISSVTIDGEASDKLPTSGYYSMSATCTKGSNLTWEPLSKTITYESGSYIEDSCSLVFTSSTDYPLLSEMSVGSYVAYAGQGGMVGETAVTCQNNGPASSSTAADETEAPNSCLGQNAREDLDNSNYTYGYCTEASFKYYTTGWRLAYVDGDKPVIISGGSPECNARPSSESNLDYIKIANTKAMKYCNKDLADGDCVCYDDDNDGLCDCTDNDNNGLCDEIENGTVDAWAVSDIDFYNITKAISGTGKRLVSNSSNLGESSCYGKISFGCGYNNDLLDIGGYYWFAARQNLNSLDGVYWNISSRVVGYGSSTSVRGLRPIISLSSKVVVTGGAGTMNDPYQIDVIEKTENNDFAEKYMIPVANSDESIDFSKTSDSTGTNGIYVRNGTEDDTYPIYYYRGAVDNNLIFAETCWKVVRTTETGGLKLIYNGVPTDGTCDNTGASSQIGTKAFNSRRNSPTYVGYMYGDVYEYTSKSLSSDTTEYVYGNDVSYANGTYTLTDTTSGAWSSVYSSGLNNYHYTCFTTGTTCISVYYVYYTSSSSAYYITLSNGENIETALSNMLDKNDNPSIIKGSATTSGTLDYWYVNNITGTDYESYVEDTIWCNDRSVYSLGGWNPDGGTTSSNYQLYFGGYGRARQTYTPDLTCTRAIDKFTVSEANGNGDLDYPVGLLTSDEIMLAGGKYNSSNSTYYLYTGQTYWVGSPYYFYYSNAYGFIVYSTGGLDHSGVDITYGVRPSISLKHGFTIASGGDGTTGNPYVVE